MYYEMTPHHYFPMNVAYPYNVGDLVQPSMTECYYWKQPTHWSCQGYLLFVILFILLIIVGKIGWLVE